jgi:hypothetical protein
VSTPLPPVDLRTRVLAAASAEPVPRRSAGTRRSVLTIVAGFLLPLAMSTIAGGPRTGGRPFGYVAALAVAWLGIGLLATMAGVSRGRSMLGRPSSLRLAVVALTPVALFATSLLVTALWPQTFSDRAEMRDHVRCLILTPVCALGPLVAFMVVRRRSDPVFPRLTGAAIGAAAGAWGSFAIELHCRYTSPGHVVATHVLPVALLTLVGVMIGDRVLAVRAEHD